MKNETQMRTFSLLDYLYHASDEKHPVSVQDILKHWKSRGIDASRKSVYHDIDLLVKLGIDVVCVKSTQNLYFIGSRLFELPELKLLVDSVQSSKFITERKSRELIKKLETLVSTYEAKQLQRQVILSGRVKTMNKSIYYTIDQIHTAINKDRQIQFQYFQWNVKKEMELRHDGAWYHISPWALVWDDEYYYLIGYDAKAEKIKHYRVDKILRLSISEEKREGNKVFREINLPRYSKGLFGMFGGEEMDVTLLCENSMAAPIIDRFGKDVHLSSVGEEHFKVTVTVSASQQFLGWVFALGKGVKIIAPESMVEAMKESAKRLTHQYLD